MGNKKQKLSKISVDRNGNIYNPDQGSSSTENKSRKKLIMAEKRVASSTAAQKDLQQSLSGQNPFFLTAGEACIGDVSKDGPLIMPPAPPGNSPPHVC